MGGARKARVHAATLGFDCARVQAQQHRTFNSAVAKQANLGHYARPVYSLNGRTPAHHSLMIDDGIGDDDDADEEVGPVPSGSPP